MTLAEARNRGHAISQAEGDRIARMVLDVITEVRRMAGDPERPNVVESTRVFVHPDDRRWVEGT